MKRCAARFVLLVAAASPLAAQVEPVFVRVPPKQAIQAPVPELGPGGFRYAIRDGALCRAREGEPQPMPCVQPEGTGGARAFVHHPAGTTWLAAERGLFCTSPEVDVLDRLELADGAPEGALVGIARTSGARFWLATSDAFGCVEARQYFGRRFGPQDGLPPGPYTALAAAADGTLLLATDDGIFRYAPDRGEAPRVAIRSVQGRAFRPGERIELAPDGALELELEGSALGGPTFRWRASQHHQWRAIEGTRARIDGLEPGDHELLFAAYDRDLRRSEPVALTLRVPYPPQFSKRLLAPLAAGFAALFFGVAWVRARRREPVGRRKAMLSALLLFVFGLQLLAGAVPHGRSWPIVGYAMYTDVYREGDLTYGMSLLGVTPARERFPVRLYGAGEAQFDLQRDLAPLIHGNAAEREAVLARYRARLGGAQRLAGLVVQDERQRLTPHGPVRVAPVILAVEPADLFDAPRR